MEAKSLDVDGMEAVTLNQFTDLPDEVIDSHILCLLEWNDLLRMRRISKRWNGIVNKFIFLHPQLAQDVEIEINETNKTLSEFMNLGIPVSKFFFQNDKTVDMFYDNPDMPDFLKLYSSKITHFRVTAISCYVCNKEREFYNALTKLESLEVARFQMTRYRPSSTGDKRTEIEVSLPTPIKQLKSLKIGSQDGRPAEDCETFGVTMGHLAECKNLEYAMLPFSKRLALADFLFPVVHSEIETLALAFQAIGATIIQNRAENFPHQPNLKIWDFETFYVADKDERLNLMERSAQTNFLNLLHLCTVHGVKLKNVVASWLPQRWNENLVHGFGNPIVSLVNLSPCAFALDLRNVEQINIKATSRCILPHNWNTDKPSWPSLKNLIITVDSENVDILVDQQLCGPYLCFDKCPTTNIFNIFENIDRPALTQLELVWKLDGKKVIPSVAKILKACPNLSKLTIVNWPGTNKAVCKLWNGLPALKEVCLDGCKDLGNVAFVGEDIHNPVFLKLKNLKKLSLKNLDQMPKITDTLFKLVLKFLNLTHLTLTSSKCLVKVTPDGITSLLTGSFASSVEKFPFNDWSLESCTDEEFKTLESEFRSYNMM